MLFLTLIWACAGLEPVAEVPMPTEPFVIVPPREPPPKPVEPVLLEVSGELKEFIHRYSGQLRYCHERELKTNPRAGGTIEVRWSVAGGATVGTPKVVGNTTADQAFGECVVRLIRRWKFPPDAEGVIQWPFVFQRPNQ